MHLVYYIGLPFQVAKQCKTLDYPDERVLKSVLGQPMIRCCCVHMFATQLPPNLLVPRVTNIKFLTISTHNQEERLWEIKK